jgi:predicted transcriptional regulator
MLRPLDSILDYFEVISKTALSEIPVISPDDSKLVLSILTMRDVNKLLNNIDDPLLPDLQKSYSNLQNINSKIFHNPSADQDFDNNSRLINKLKDYWAR